MITISIKPQIDEIVAGLKRFEQKQVPFATALAVTKLAHRVADAEREALPKVFDRPTPFTMDSIGVRGATKEVPVAIVFVKPVAAKYLEPFETGGTHFLGTKQGLITPKNIGVNQYGNLPRTALKRLKGKANVFVGPIKTRGGIVSGVWQRPATRGRRGRKTGRGRGVQRGHLKLLIRFTSPMNVKQHFNFEKRAEDIVAQHYKADFEASLQQAIATAR